MARATVHLFPRDRLDPTLPTGLILGGMGGPDGADSVEPFLRNLFRDPAILPLPAPLACLVGRVIVRRRAGAVRARYASLGCGGGSPQLDWARRQCIKLESSWNKQGFACYAAPAMRYWHPFPAETVDLLRRRGARQFLVVPAYPQFSATTSGTTLEAICQAIREAAPHAALHCVADWYLLPGYLDALVRRAGPVLRSWAEDGVAPDRCALLPVAHSLPERIVRRGDPYLDQTRATVDALRGELATRLAGHQRWWDELPGGGRPLLAFQSKIGPLRWLGPGSDAEVRRLAANGCRRLLVLPVSFTCEHIETLHELDVELATTARAAGIEKFVRGTALNLDEGWLASLAAHLISAAFVLRPERSLIVPREASHA